MKGCPTCRELVIAKMYLNAIVSELNVRKPNIQVIPSIGNKITDERIPTLQEIKSIVETLRSQSQCYNLVYRSIFRTLSSI